MSEVRLDVAETLRDKRILFVGSTGFVGKVALSMLLRRYPGIGKVFVLVRPGAGSSSEERFFKKVAGSPVFDPIREVWGEGFQAFLHEKVSPLPGDVARPLLNFSEEDLSRLAPLDAIINCAGLVSFDPSLETALRINTYGVQNVVEVARRTGACVIHVSTCFVAGNRDGEIWEDEPLLGFFPRKEEDGQFVESDFSVESEIADCERLIEQVRARADDKAHVSMFREKGAARLKSEGRDADDERNLKVAIQRERKTWMSEQLTALGMERAQHWGWPNTYTYTKSLGDQVCAAESAKPDGVRTCLVRPSIVESAVRYPFPGWNEGFTTTAPLVMLSILGHQQFPVGERNVLDLIPVDLVAAGLIAATAATIAKENAPVYQLASGDENPLLVKRAVWMLGLYKRKKFQARETGPAWLNRIKSRLEPVPVSRERWEKRSAPMWKGFADGLIKAIDEATPRWGAPRIQAMAERAKDKLGELSNRAGQTIDLFEMFMPFIHERAYVFRCDQTRALFAKLSDADRLALPWDPQSIEWREYWLDVHLPGLEKWVFPSLEEEFKAKPKSVYTYRDLLEMFDTTTKHHRNRTAMRQLGAVSDGRFVAEGRRYTYGELQERASRGAAVLGERGVVSGDRVLLVSENRPEWGIAYFAILKAGAAAVPIDANATSDELINLAKSARAKAAIISDRVWQRLFREQAEAIVELSDLRLSFDELDRESRRGAATALVHRPRADELASLIFTSGTTGKPKGVMLSHRNFSSLLSKLASVFDIDKHDGLLSVLPLHHTFEFTAGLLMPLMRGAQIAYLEEIDAESLSAAFAGIPGGAPVTGMVGVPALWQLLHRRVTRAVSDRGPIVERAFEVLVSLGRTLRDGMPPILNWLNVGKLAFYPVHARLGGNLRLMISGGSALPADVMKGFRGMGFGLYEGYGLTEAAPVLAVHRPGSKVLPGSVGEPLPGIDVRIDSPDERGVGEIVAQGPNVMLGYYEDPEATAATIKNGWLHTGDLGRFDEQGRLYVVGRKKEMILGASGENVYPDELEDVYRDSPWIKELSIVGLPAEHNELVACLVVPEYEPAGMERVGREAVREKVREHVRQVSGKLPVYKRIKVLHFTDVELPKTATRKVKRKVVVEELKKLERVKRLGEQRGREGGQDYGHGYGHGHGHGHGHEDTQVAVAAAGGDVNGADSAGFLRELLATVVGKAAGAIAPSARLEELGFDSLMYTELGVALEAAGVVVPEDVDLTGVGTVEELAKLVDGWGTRGKRVTSAVKAKRRDVEGEAGEVEIEVPESIARLGSAGLDWAQKMTYERFFDTRVTGRAYLPKNAGFVVAANHASHLDMGLVKHALGEWGPRLVALAAKDYFFDDPVRRAYFENFTSLVPMERHGSLRESLRLAHEVIRKGYVLLIFPEGTRSETGVMSDFKASIGYLALQSHVDVVPMYLEGTHDAMPKGSLLPKRRDIAAHIGPTLGWQSLKAAVEKLPRGEHYREAARLVEAAVRRLAPAGPDRREPSKGSNRTSEERT